MTRRNIPGFGLSLGLTIVWLGLIIMIPLAALFIKAAGMGAADCWKLLGTPRVLAAFKLTFGASAAAAAVNTVLGMIVAWVLTRYRFPGRRLLDAAVDLPFALPTAVAGITLTTLYAPNGWIGKWLATIGIKGAYSAFGVFIALAFIGLPFVVRTLQPVMEDMGKDLEESAATLGATRWQTFRRVILPLLAPALATGFTLAFARALGEYGSVIFISGNLPMKTEIVPLLIVNQLEQYRYQAAAVIAAAMLLASFLLLLIINLLQRHFDWRNNSKPV